MKTILITGGCGFLGRHLGIRLKDKYRVVLGARDNTQNLLAAQQTGCEAIPLDVVSIESVRDVISRYRPQIIIHTAAMKFVDIAEENPLTAIDVNVTGSQNIARVAIDKGVEAVIGISTDKASSPHHNLYAATKVLMERTFCLLAEKTATAFACVRFGNIAWSSGSVFPIWKNMIEEKGVIYSTGPNMRRYFFSVDEAVDLVIKCMNNIQILNGKVLIKKMKSAKIADILEIWIKNFGGRWEIAPHRPGDCDDEYLLSQPELPFSEELILDNESHYVISYSHRSKIPVSSEHSTLNAERLSEREILDLLRKPAI